jgi:hypothetical protein
MIFSRALAALTFTLIGSAPALAQSLYELPPDVTTVAMSYVRDCEAAGGTPDYNPLEYVKFVFFGDDWNGGGRESYLVDTSKLTCAGVDPRPACAPGEGCTLAIVTPRGADRFELGYEERVNGWRLIGANASDGGPNVSIEINDAGGTGLYSVTAAGVSRQ